MSININRMKKAQRILSSEFAQMTTYMSSGEKVRLTYILEDIRREMRGTDAPLDRFIQSISQLESTLLISGVKFDSKSERNEIYNHLADFLITFTWYILKEEGRDVGEEPWKLEEFEKTEEEEEEVQIPGVLLEQ